MRDDWHNNIFARHWDTHTSRFNSTRSEQLDLIVRIISDTFVPYTTVLDLGSGSGQLEEALLSTIGGVEIVGVDSSEAMLSLAQERLKGFGSRFKVVQGDLTTLKAECLPACDYSIAVSVQVFHELDGFSRDRLFRDVYQLLRPGGLFLLCDRVKVDLNTFDKCYASLWRRLEKDALPGTALAFERYRRTLSEKEDHPAPLDEYLRSMNTAGFKSTPLHLYLDRALVVGLKDTVQPGS